MPLAHSEQIYSSTEVIRAKFQLQAKLIELWLKEKKGSEEEWSLTYQDVFRELFQDPHKQPALVHMFHGGEVDEVHLQKLQAALDRALQRKTQRQQAA